MPLRIRFQHPPAATLGFAIERLADAACYRFTGPSAGRFAAIGTAARADLIAPLPEDETPWRGRYRATLDPTPVATFPDGEYCVSIHDRTLEDLVIALLRVTLERGDDAPVPTASGAASVDPWAVRLPGAYPAGTAGALLVSRLDVPVSSRLAASGYAPAPEASQVAAAVWDEPRAAHGRAGSYGVLLDAPISTRSTYAGRPVAAVTAPVSVGTNLDKSGYLLAAAGLDAVPVEAGVNARQALAPMLAALAGTLSGAGTGAIQIRGGNTSVTRIQATTDAAGNRTAVVLLLPA